MWLDIKDLVLNCQILTCIVISQAILGVLTMSKKPTECDDLNSPYSESKIIETNSDPHHTWYGKCPKILNTLFHAFFWLKFCFLCSCLLKCLVEWLRSSPIWVCTVCKHLDVQNFRTFTLPYIDLDKRKYQPIQVNIFFYFFMKTYVVGTQ